MSVLARVLLVFLLGATFGCVTPGSSSFFYNPPERPKPPNEITVEEPFNVVSDRLVARIARSFFVINNIEKESRLINLSF
jgi:hypothetical protein